MVPPVLIARLTAQTMSIRVGAGGVMLPNHFRSSSPSGSRRLRCWSPDASVWGPGGEPGTAYPEVAALLRHGRPAVTDEEYANEIATTLGYFDVDASVRGSLAGFAPSPRLLASSESGARLAARSGLPCRSRTISVHRTPSRPSLCTGASSGREGDWIAPTSCWT